MSGSRYDIAVVGAGPAGSTAARYAAEAGARVLLLDRRREIGVPVQCGEYVAKNHEVANLFPTVRDIDDLMEIPNACNEGDTPIIRLYSPKGRTFDVPFRGYSVQRDVMDRRLADRAADAGADLHTATTFRTMRGTTLETDRGTFEARVVVGADGPRSTVAAAVGLPHPVSAPAMSAVYDGPFDDVTHLRFGNLAPGGYAWIIPKRGAANVGLGTWQYYNGRLNELFWRFTDGLDLPRRKGFGGWVPVLGPIPETVRGNVLLAGDAAGHVMATNGGGINVAMICGRIAGQVAAEHVRAGTPLASYETRWRAAVGGPLKTGARIKRLADRFFSRDGALELSMRFLGARRMERAIRCRPLFFGGAS
jgi:digeranylgeranylglycerophospholipid reductase